MPKNDNTIQFSLNTEQRDKLKLVSIGDESIGLTAKRIILEALGEQRKISLPPELSEIVDRITAIEDNLPEQLKSVEERVNSIEIAIECEHYPEEKVSQRLTAIEKTISALQYQINQATSPVKRPSSPPPRPQRKK